MAKNRRSYSCEFKVEAVKLVTEKGMAVAEAALLMTDEALRAGGGASFGRRLTVERNFRDARAASVMAPTTDVLYDFIDKTLPGMPLF